MIKTPAKMQLTMIASHDLRTACNQRLANFDGAGGEGHLLVPGGCTCCMGSSCCSCSW